MMRSRSSALSARGGHDRPSRLRSGSERASVRPAPVGDDRGVQALAPQQRALLARLGAAVVLGQDRQLVVGPERPPSGVLAPRPLRGPQALAAPAVAIG